MQDCEIDVMNTKTENDGWNITDHPNMVNWETENRIKKKVQLDRENFILLTDSYKLTQWPMYPDGTENISSYFESRPGAKYPYTVVFGLQMILKRYFTGVVVTKEDVDLAEAFSDAHFGVKCFNRKMWDRIVNVHGGKLPIRIKAAPEGLPVPTNNVLFYVEATDDKCAALVSPCETIITHFWHPSNVATISRDLRVFMSKHFDKTVDEDQLFLLAFMLHDFGFRGVSSVESAGMGGSGHLVNFMGTDTIIGITYAQRYYKAGMAGFSVPASEHSVMCSKGKKGELEMIVRLIEKYPKGILSVVSDSYSIVKVLTEYLPLLKDTILAREGKFVVRPDSPRFKGDKACDQVLWIAQELEKTFGSTVNKKGYKILNPKVGIIYGDGLSVEEIKECVELLVANGWAASTCVFGMGGGLLQKHNRDTQRNAFKCSAQYRDGEWVDNQKQPLDITKASKKGRLKLVWEVGAHGKTLTTVPIEDPREDVLVTVFENGSMVKEWTWDEVKANALTKLIGEVYE